MSRDRLRRTLPFVAMIAMMALTAPGPASAQQRAGALFNQLFNVGGVGARGGSDDGNGSTGCGGGSGGRLSTALNSSLGAIGGTGFDSDQAIGARRDLWRFCDNMTDNVFGGSGSWTPPVITPDAERDQNAGFAPAELFEQTNVAQSLGRWHGQNVALRIQQLRVAMRSGETPAEVRVAHARGRTVPLVTLSELVADERSGFFDLEARREAANQRFMSGLGGLSLGSTTDWMGVEGLGWWGNVRYHRMNADTTLDQRGGTTNGGGVTVGADYKLSDRSFVGGAFGYSGFSTEFDFGLGDSSTSDYSFMAFGSHFFGDRFYVDGLLRGAYTSFDQTRLVPVFDGGPAFLPRTSEPSGGSVTVDAGAGMDWSRDAWRVNPYVRLRVTWSRFGAFDEQGGDGSLNLHVNDQDVTSVPITLGTSASYNLSTGLGVVSPYVRVQYLHEFNDQVPLVEGFLLAIPNARFALPPNAVDRDYLQVGGGTTLALAGGWSGYLDYDALVAYTALTTHTLTLGARREF